MSGPRIIGDDGRISVHRLLSHSRPCPPSPLLFFTRSLLFVFPTVPQPFVCSGMCVALPEDVVPLSVLCACDDGNYSRKTAPDFESLAVQVAAEAMKLLVAALPVASLVGTDAETAVMALFVSFVLECGAPRELTPPAALSNLSFTLLTHVAGTHATLFRSVVAALSLESKARLQVLAPQVSINPSKPLH